MKKEYLYYGIAVFVVLGIIGYFAGWFSKKSSNGTSNSGSGRFVIRNGNNNPEQESGRFPTDCIGECKKYLSIPAPTGQILYKKCIANCPTTCEDKCKPKLLIPHIGPQEYKKCIDECGGRPNEI